MKLYPYKCNAISKIQAQVRKFVSSFLALLISVSLPAYFTENLNPIAGKFAFLLGRFEVELSQIQVFRKTHFEFALFLKTFYDWVVNFKTIQKRILGFGKRYDMQDDTENEKEISFCDLSRVLTKASRNLLQDIEIQFQKRIRPYASARQMTRSCDFRRNNYFKENFDKFHFWYKTIFCENYSYFRTFSALSWKFLFPAYTRVWLIASHVILLILAPQNLRKFHHDP